MSIGSVFAIIDQACHRLSEDVIPVVNTHKNRGVGYQLESILRDHITAIEPSATSPESTKSTYDVRIGRYMIDIKSKYVGATFHMPNLVSCEKLVKDPSIASHMILVFIAYDNCKDSVCIQSCESVLLSRLSWEGLTIGNLGLGQIQLKRIMDPIEDEYDWFNEFLKHLRVFYRKQISKFGAKLALI